MVQLLGFFLSNVTTVQAVLNSATGVRSIPKIFNHIINAVGEWVLLKKK